MEELLHTTIYFLGFFFLKKKFAFLVNCLTLPFFRSERNNGTYWCCQIIFLMLSRLTWGHMQQFFLFDRYLNTYKKYQDLLNNKAETEINAFIQDEPVLLALSKVPFFLPWMLHWYYKMWRYGLLFRYSQPLYLAQCQCLS